MEASLAKSEEQPTQCGVVQEWCAWIVKSHVCEVFFALMIVSNSAYLGVQLEWSSQNRDRTTPLHSESQSCACQIGRVAFVYQDCRATKCVCSHQHSLCRDFPGGGGLRCCQISAFQCDDSQYAMHWSKADRHPSKLLGCLNLLRSQVCLRLVASGPGAYFLASGWAWNWLDVFVVLLGCVAACLAI